LYVNRGAVPTDIPASFFIGSGSRYDSKVTLRDCYIAHNTADFGGGVYISQYITLVLSGSTVIDNTAMHDGGGAYIATGYHYSAPTSFAIDLPSFMPSSLTSGPYGFGTLKMEDSTISDNIASGNGGGVYNNGAFAMSGSEMISGNTAKKGGGVYIGSGGTAEIFGGTISGNVATQDGGGIYTTDYANLKIASVGAKFSGNSAEVAYVLDPNSPDYIDFYRFLITPISPVWTASFDYGYNNFDINYTKGARATLLLVIFDPRDGTNVADFQSSFVLFGKTTGISMPPTPSISGHAFKGWNTIPDGSGKMFTRETAVVDNIIVYAQWSPLYTLAINGSFGTSAMGSGAGEYEQGDVVTINAGSRDGYVFVDWTADSVVGFADANAVGTTFTMPDKDVIITANWEAILPLPSTMLPVTTSLVSTTLTTTTITTTTTSTYTTPTTPTTMPPDTATQTPTSEPALPTAPSGATSDPKPWDELPVWVIAGAGVLAIVVLVGIMAGVRVLGRHGK